MSKVIVPKNHISVSTTNHSTTISTVRATINANIYPTFVYEDGNIIIDRTIQYTQTPATIYATSDINYRINLYNTSEVIKEVRFIKLTLTDFPIYRDNRTGTNLSALSVKITIYKKSNYINSDCTITLLPDDSGVLNVNGVYWLTFDTSTKKYSVTDTPSIEPLLIYKAIVPNKDNWMDFDNITQYSPTIETQMTVDIEEWCNQPYIGRIIRIQNYSSSDISILSNTTYNLTINTKDKILGINHIELGNFIGKAHLSNALPTDSKLTFNIFINNNSTAVYSTVFTIPGYVTGTTPIIKYIIVDNLYIDVKNNKTITEDKLSKAIDIF